MENRMILSLVLVFAVVCLAGVYTLSLPAEKKDGGRIGVIVSIAPQAEFVERVGGDKVDVITMVPPGADPHTFEPTPSKMAEASWAKMYAMVGSGIEFELAWADRITSLGDDLLVVDCSKGIERIESEDEDEPGNDVHIWTSVRNAKRMTENIYDGLVGLDPANEEYYTKNKDEYLQELDELDGNISRAVSGKKSRYFIVYHPAWAYFARDYGLKQISVEGGGKEPTSKGIVDLIKKAKDNNITVIFASPQFSTKSAEVIAGEIGGKVVLIDPLEKDYLQNMRRVAEAFAGA